MHVVSTVHSKGGVGKSTIAVNVARALQLRDLDVCIIDTDKQSTAQSWRASGSDDLPPVYGVQSPGALEGDVKRLAGAFDVAVIDGGAHLQEMHAAIIKASDLVLIPLQPSPGDVWPTDAIVEMVKTRQHITDGQPKAAFVISRKKPRTRLASAISEALERYEIPVWEGTCDRVAYAEALGKGLAAVETGDDKAASEIETLTNHIITTLTHE